TGEKPVRADELFSAVDFSPYEDYVLRMWPAATIVGGRLVYQDGEFVGDDHRGQVLNQNRGQETTQQHLLAAAVTR
ncbi:hypothetical protein ACFQ9V_20605, partial [Leifsonia sp. NPDC056665]|uniref:hypothetical protein n=1 Tax=Leifsonia sp. NPDC056665 TaxID=3345901 RepID=UPI003696D1AA